jgi:predicted membrane-bound spermidine synthase
LFAIVTEMKRFGERELIAFGTGFALMTFELVAARILAPAIGSSTYVWTSVIGVIIAALSFGYWQGGILADARNRQSDIVWLLVATAITIVWTLGTYGPILTWAVAWLHDPRLQAVVAATILFAPASFLFGVISPYLAKLQVHSLAATGRAIASLGACNSVGGIVGTFTTGFVLFNVIGLRETLGVLIVMLLTTSWLIERRYRCTLRLIISCGIGAMVGILLIAGASREIAIDTATAHYAITEGQRDGELIRTLRTGPNAAQSAVYLDGSDRLPFWYTREIARLTIAQKPARILILGGGVFTLPQYLAHQLPNTTIDVVEIDPQLETIATQYFNYSHPANVQPVFRDARTYLQQHHAPYDVIIVDVYGDGQIPPSFMTAEYGRELTAQLAPQGVVLVNVIAGLESSSCRALFGALDSVYRPYLPYARYSTQNNAKTRRGNYVGIYGRQPLSFAATTELPPLHGTLYYDNFVPSEHLYYACRYSR